MFLKVTECLEQKTNKTKKEQKRLPRTKQMNRVQNALKVEIFGGRNFRGTNFHDFGHKLQTKVPRNLQNTE